MTSRDKKRRSEIIRELCRLARGGWVNARREDYAPLEAELRALEEKAGWR